MKHLVSLLLLVLCATLSAAQPLLPQQTPQNQQQQIPPNPQSTTQQPLQQNPQQIPPNQQSAPQQTAPSNQQQQNTPGQQTQLPTPNQQSAPQQAAPQQTRPPITQNNLPTQQSAPQQAAPQQQTRPPITQNNLPTQQSAPQNAAPQNQQQNPLGNLNIGPQNIVSSIANMSPQNLAELQRVLPQLSSSLQGTPLGSLFSGLELLVNNQDILKTLNATTTSLGQILGTMNQNGLPTNGLQPDLFMGALDEGTGRTMVGMGNFIKTVGQGVDNIFEFKKDVAEHIQNLVTPITDAIPILGPIVRQINNGVNDALDLNHNLIGGSFENAGNSFMDMGQAKITRSRNRTRRI